MNEWLTTVCATPTPPSQSWRTVAGIEHPGRAQTRSWGSFLRSSRPNLAVFFLPWWLKRIRISTINEWLATVWATPTPPSQ